MSAEDAKRYSSLIAHRSALITGAKWMQNGAMNWLVYGANGYTGELIAREAVRRGHRPILAGRDAKKIEALARELGCEWRAFGLDAIDLHDVSLVLHCAGPFILTSAPMVDACVK